MSGPRASAPEVEEQVGGEGPGAKVARAALDNSLSLGLLAMLPLLLAYELALGAQDLAPRNTSELLLLRGARLLPFDERDLRILGLALASTGAALLCFRRRSPLLPGLLRIVLEGILFAILLGPLLALAMRWLPGEVGRLEVSPLPPPTPPGPAEAAAAFGGAAYEELVFRVGLFSLGFLAAQQVLRFFGAGERTARSAARGIALAASSLAFAAFHLDLCTRWLGPGGEAFSAPVFAWRACAGLALCSIFLWRGPGVAAWTHGLFNFALLLGAGPEVLL